jgi:hypothetical protein
MNLSTSPSTLLLGNLETTDFPDTARYVVELIDMIKDGRA